MATPTDLLANAGAFLALGTWQRRVVEMRRLADLLLDSNPAADVTPAGLLVRSGCYLCLTEHELTVMRVQLSADVALIFDPEAPVTPSGVAAQMGCWMCLEPGLRLAAEILAIPAIVTETLSETMQRSACYACLSFHELYAMEVRILADLILTIYAGADVTPSGVLGRAGCWSCMSSELLHSAAGIIISGIDPPTL